MPILAFLFFFSKEVVWIIFGEGWSDTSDLVPALALIGIMRALGNPGGAIILALGRAEVGFWWNTIWATTIVIALTLGLMLFPSAQTAVYILLGLTLTLGMCWHVIIAKVSKINYLPIAIHFIKIFIVVMTIGKLGLSIVDIIEITNQLLRVIIGSITCGLIYMVYNATFEQKILHTLRNMI